MNYKLTVQYDGTDFCGWQTQAEGRSVQGELSRALSLLDGDEVVLHGAGRTDAGVHALAQVASARLRRAWEPQRLRAAVNGNVGRDLRVTEVEEAPDDFHARYSARGKTYLYRVFNAPFMSPFWARYALHEARALDLSAMRDAAALFVGEHDWTAFSCAQADVKSRVRRVTRVEVAERESACGRLVEIGMSAEGFLRYMARSVAGALLGVARGELKAETVTRALKTGERSLAPATAPAYGLTLVRVHYEAVSD